MICLHQNDAARFSSKPHPPALVIRLVPPSAAVTRVPHSSAGCTTERAGGKHCGRQGATTEPEAQGKCCRRTRSIFFFKSSSSISRRCSWIFTCTTPIFYSTSHQNYLSFCNRCSLPLTHPNSKTFHAGRRAAKEALLLSDLSVSEKRSVCTKGRNFTGIKGETRSNKR